METIESLRQRYIDAYKKASGCTIEISPEIMNDREALEREIKELDGAVIIVEYPGKLIDCDEAAP